MCRANLLSGSQGPVLRCILVERRVKEEEDCINTRQVPVSISLLSPLTPDLEKVPTLNYRYDLA